jgi:hypothetical protein
MQRPEEFVPVSLEPDPVIEYYKQFIDRSLLRENLKLTPTERVRKFLPSTTCECHHDPPRDPQNPNESLTPCKDGCVVTYFGRLLHCLGYLDGTIQECDVGFDPDRQSSAWAYQELRRFIGCRADREHWQEFPRINVGCGSCAQWRVMWRCVIDDRDNQDRCKRGRRIWQEYRRPGFKCCSEGGVSPTIGTEYSIPANTL